jgi:hypothetical protein
MKMRPPAVPLVTVDPYFSIWSMADALPGEDTRHWTGKPHRLTGVLETQGQRYLFMGKGSLPQMKQEALDVDALSSRYRFSCPRGTLEVTFTTPLLLEDLMLVSRPISYIHFASPDLADARIILTLDEEICLNAKGQSPVEAEVLELPGLAAARCGNKVQAPLNAEGDDLRIDWGYLYCATAQQDGEAWITETGGLGLSFGLREQALAVLAYDDVQSLEYFGRPLKAYWARAGKPLSQLLGEAIDQWPSLKTRCDSFALQLHTDACRIGGEKYAEILALAYRQAIAAHKLCLDEQGQLLFISKECFSNGCAATVDVSYPSIPLFLLYQPKLVAAMMRPIFRYAQGPVWPFDFAPHDCGCYPRLNGQVYSNGTDPDKQMPVEECGNMLVMAACHALAEGDVSFARQHWDSLTQWVKYLLRYGMDPENQLCTDDFAGHLAHNVNLSVKAIMGIEGFAILNRMLDYENEAQQYTQQARHMAKNWRKTAANEDGTFRLAFDREGSVSMKYNMVWDMIWGSGIFEKGLLDKELAGYVARTNRYGLALDNRSTYTKSDWLVWCAAMTETQEDFRAMVDALWLAYHESPSRVPLTDWFDTITAQQENFQNRTVQGGLFLPLLLEKGTLRLS